MTGYRDLGFQGCNIKLVPQFAGLPPSYLPSPLQYRQAGSQQESTGRATRQLRAAKESEES